MSSLFVRALEAVSGGLNSLAGEPWDTLRLMDTVKKSYELGSVTFTLMTPQFSRISDYSTDDPIVEKWISLLPDSHVSPSVLRENDVMRTTIETSGPMSLESSEKCGQDMHFSKTHLDSTVCPTLKPYSEIWKEAVTKSALLSRSQLASSDAGRPDDDSGFSLPTLTASNYGSNQGGAQGRTGKVRYSLQSMARRGELETFGHSAGQLMPAFSEYLMGFPIGATATKDLGTHRYQQWLLKHGTD